MPHISLQSNKCSLVLLAQEPFEHSLPIVTRCNRSIPLLPSQSTEHCESLITFSQLVTTNCRVDQGFLLNLPIYDYLGHALW